VNGVWYEVTVQKFPNADAVKNNYRLTGQRLLPFRATIHDEVLDRFYASFDELERIYGGHYIAVSKRRLPKRVIRAAGLT